MPFDPDFYKNININDYDENGEDINKLQKEQEMRANIRKDAADKLNGEIEKKLKAIKIMLYARSFEAAAAMIDEVENLEKQKESKGYCDNPEVYWCKILLKNRARDEADLVSKNPELEDDTDYLLAVNFCESEEQKQRFSAVAEKIRKQSAKSEEIVETSAKPVKNVASSDGGDIIKNKLRRVSRLIDAGEFNEAKERLEKIEQEEEDCTGDCVIPQVYHYKMLLDYGVRTDDELIARLVKNQEDIAQNKNYRLAKSCAEDAENEDEFEALLAIKKKSTEGIAEAERKAEEERKRLAGDYYDLGNGYVTFGTYPQSKKAGNVNIGEIYDDGRGYYLGSDNCLYEKYDGEYYKVEPIKWKVLSRGGECFIVSDMIIDQHRFDYDSSNYANGEIRSWLNNDFYNKAFKDSQQSKIVTTNVDNSLSSTGNSSNKYVCENTSDKVFLLSYKEAQQYLSSNSSHHKKCTDYVKARNTACWWLRSPCVFKSDTVQAVYLDGRFTYCYDHDDTVSVVPALIFKP